MSDSAKEDDEEKGTQTLMDEEPENDGETTQANDPDIAEDQEEDSYDSGFDYVPAISAQPPKVVQQEEGQMEVSASPAFQCLDELFQQGKLSGTKVALLKAKYTELHDTLKKENELRLLQEAKHLSVDLEKQGSELEKGDRFPENANTEVLKLREQLLKHLNEVAQADERQYQLDYKVECLEEEKRMVGREYGRMPKQGEVEKKIEDLKQVCAEVKKETGQRQLEAKTLKEDLDKKNRQIQVDSKTIEKLKEEIEKMKVSLQEDLIIFPKEI